MDKKYNVVIVGAGPAAWSASIYLARAGISVLVIGKLQDSGLYDATEVWNYPGFTESQSGQTLLGNMKIQAEKQGVQFISGEVTHVEKSEEQMAKGESKLLVRTADRKKYWADNLLLAHGANFIKVNLPGEKELVGKGIHYCALCDGPHYKNKEVVVFGNSNLAAEEAIQLSAYAKVKIISHNQATNFSPEYQKLLSENNIAIVLARVEKIEKENEAVKLTIRNTTGTITCDSASGVFVALGVASSIVFAKKLGLEMEGNFLKADPKTMRTNVPGVWAAGLARGGVNQIVKSVGDAGIAAVDMIKTLKGLPQYIDHT